MIRQRQRGFTLIEVMLAIALMAMIMAMAYGGFRASVRVTNSGEAIIEENNRLRVVQQFVRRQLMLAQALVIEEEEDGHRIRFQADRDYVRFVSPMPGYLSYGGPYVQQFSLEQGAEGLELVFYYAMLNGYEPGDLSYSDGIVLIDNIARGEFHFLGLDEENQEPFWSDFWEEPERLPLAVALEMDLDRDRNQVWPDLVAPVMIDAGQAMDRRQIRRGHEMLIPSRRDRKPRERR